MKKFISSLLAVIIMLSVFSVIPFAANEEQAVGAENIGDYMLSDGIYYFPESVTAIEENAFEGAGARAVCFTGEKLSLPAKTGLDSGAVILLNNSAKDKDGFDSKCAAADVAEETGCKWFAFDLLSFFGKTVLAFFYEPLMTEDFAPCFDKLVGETDPDLIYFESLGNKSAFYADGGASLGDILGGAQTNPGFITGLLMNFYTSLLKPKDYYYNNPGLNSGAAALAAIIMSLFKKKKK